MEDGPKEAGGSQARNGPFSFASAKTRVSGNFFLSWRRSLANVNVVGNDSVGSRDDDGRMMMAERAVDQGCGGASRL